MGEKLHYADTPANRQRKWLGLPVAPSVFGNAAEVFRSLPQFGRQPFSMPSVNGDEVGFNPHMDMIYRVGFRRGENPIPVGVVSKNYRLVDHHQVFRAVSDVLVECDIKLNDVRVRADWTVYGERARFSLILPPEDRFKIQLGQKDEMRVRIEIFNSVEGSCRLMAVAGWLRLVCSNGLIIGTGLLQLRQQHRQQLQVEELGRLLREAIKFVARDRKTVNEWLCEPVDGDILRSWADEDVRKLWGVKAAVRVLGLTITGHDVEPIGELKNMKPSEIRVRNVGEVPGMSGAAKKFFGVSQALTWLAGQRSELSEDLEWRGQVPDLMEKFEKRSGMVPCSIFEI